MGGALGVFIGPRFRPGLMNGDHHNRKGQSYKVFDIARELGMKENDVHRLWGSFCDSDVTGDGILQVNEFLIMQKLENLHDFGKLCFRVFDLDGSGYLSFEEYIIVMWNLLTLDDTSLPLFAFRIFDADNSGKEVGEVSLYPTTGLTPTHSPHDKSVPFPGVLNRDELLECVKIVCGGSKMSMDIALQFALENDRDKVGEEKHERGGRVMRSPLNHNTPRLSPPPHSFFLSPGRLYFLRRIRTDDVPVETADVPGLSNHRRAP